MKRRIEMKKLMAIILTIAIVMSLCVVPASAADGKVTITITPDKSSVDTTTGDAVVTYTVKAKVNDSTLKVGALTITLDPGAGLTLAEGKEDSTFYYKENLNLYYHDTFSPSGIFTNYNYALGTKTLVAAGATEARNLNSAKGEVVLMTIMGKIAQGTTGSVTLGVTTCTYGDVKAEASHDCDFNPATVTISKAPISSVTIADLDAPVKGAAPDTNVTVTPAGLTAEVNWFDDATQVTGNFAANTAYTVKIKLTASGGDNFAETVTAGDYTVKRNSDTELLLTKTFGATAGADSLGGTVTIDNTNPKFDDTLTANTTGLTYGSETAGTLTYQWYRGDTAIPSATGKSYTTVAEDVGKTIKVKVKNSNNSGSVTSASTAAVVKADGPAKPTGLAVVSVTDTTITVTKNSAWQYSKDGGSNWQDSNVFTGLTPNTTYNQIVARVTETATHNAGAKSATISATTAMGSADTATITQLKATHTPYTGTYDGNSHNAFTVTALPSGWSVAGYSSTETGTYSTTLPTVTKVADSGTIYVKFSHTSYADVIAEYTVTVNRAPLSIKAKDHTITYGEAPANKGVAITGFVNGENDTVLTGAKDYGYGSYVQYSNAGNYPIVPKNYEADNYHITFTSGKLTVQQKEVGLTWVNHTGRVWGDDKTVTATATGTVNGDVINVTVTGGDATAVGGHTATATGLTGTKAGNYKLPAANTQTYTIGKATFTSAPAEKEVKHIHTATGEMTVSLAGLVPGATNYALGTPTDTNTILSASSVDATSGKVKYTLKGTGASGNTATLPVTITSTNYNDVTVNVKITLTNKMDQADLKITGDQTVVYGKTLQLGTSGGSGDGAVTYTVSPSGYANIDSDGNLTTLKVGTITVTATKEEDPNYNAITSNPVTITITQATPTGTPKYTAITTSGKTLADAGLTTTGSTLTPTGGTIEWVDNAGNVLPGNTKVEANKEYKWRYTPASADAVNYAPVYGTIVVYPVSTGIVIYSPCYTIKASAGANGTISPAGWCSVVENGSQTFTFTPDKGYTVAKVLVDGKSVGAVKSYTFKDVTKDHTIEVIFMKSNGNPATGAFVMP